jgi:hypothetical protein
MGSVKFQGASFATKWPVLVAGFASEFPRQMLLRGCGGGTQRASLDGTQDTIRCLTCACLGGLAEDVPASASVRDRLRLDTFY